MAVAAFISLPVTSVYIAVVLASLYICPPAQNVYIPELPKSPRSIMTFGADAVMRREEKSEVSLNPLGSVCTSIFSPSWN